MLVKVQILTSSESMRFELHPRGKGRSYPRLSSAEPAGAPAGSIIELQIYEIKEGGLAIIKCKGRTNHENIGNTDIF